jgi:hypothetical protein
MRVLQNKWPASALVYTAMQWIANADLVQSWYRVSGPRKAVLRVKLTVNFSMDTGYKAMIAQRR